MLNVNVTAVAAENGGLTFSLESTTGFPPLPVYQWFYNGVLIPADSTNPVISSYPDITFTNISRNDSGNYSMTASVSGAGSVTGYFILDVQCKC